MHSRGRPLLVLLRGAVLHAKRRSCDDETDRGFGSSCSAAASSSPRALPFAAARGCWLLDRCGTGAGAATPRATIARACSRAATSFSAALCQSADMRSTALFVL